MILYVWLVGGLVGFTVSAAIFVFKRWPRGPRSLASTAIAARLAGAVIAGCILFLPFFYLSYFAACPWHWLPPLHFFDWALPVAWGFLVVHAWWKGKTTIRRHAPTVLYLLSPLPIFAANLAWPAWAIRWSVMGLFAATLLAWGIAVWGKRD